MQPGVQANFRRTIMNQKAAGRTLVAYEGAQLRMKRASQRWCWSYSNQLGFRQNPVEFINIGRFREIVVEPGFYKCQLVRLGAITRNCN
jgi:hypothetical protein